MLSPITVLLTAAGCPGASTCIRHLQGIEERNIRVVGVDGDIDSVGKYMADSFYQIPLVSDSNYIPELLNVAIKEKVDCILVSSSSEVELISENIKCFNDAGIKVLVSSTDSLQVANNKHRLYEKFSGHNVVKVPQFFLVKTVEEFAAACHKLGYPEKSVCFKPPVSKGSRGFRYIYPGVNRADLLLNYKPDNKMIDFDEAVQIFSGMEKFPELLVMENIEGSEVDTMVIAHKGQALLITHKTRDRERGGVITLGQHCHMPDLDVAVRAIIKEIPLSYNIGIQFKGGALIEINPRLSSFLYMKDWVEPYFAIKLALAEYSAKEVKDLQRCVPYDLKMIRYFDQCFFTKNGAPVV